MTLPQDFIAELEKAIQGELRLDLVTRLLYSTDASIYQIEPLGVVFPRHEEDLEAVVRTAVKYQVPLLPRGGGSSLAGQAVGKALILDTSRYLTKTLDINPQERTAVVESGVVLSNLNRALKVHGLCFGPDPASAERATMGGSIANNATGAHSIQYGMAADHLLAAKVILADGRAVWFQPLPLEDVLRRTQAQREGGIESALYRFALQVREQAGDQIMRGWPEVWRRSAGYNLNYLLPWSPTKPPAWESWQDQNPLPYPPLQKGDIHLAPLFAGSEGTLGVLAQIKLNLVPLPRARVLALLAYDSIAEACERTIELLDFHPTAVELIPGDLISLSRSVPAYARQFGFLSGVAPALLVVEFSGESMNEALSRAKRLGSGAILIESLEQQKQVWDVRKVGLGILDSRPGDLRPVSFIEDLSVPLAHLGEFVREMERIMERHGTRAFYYAHASAGCLHIRPLLNLKGKEGVENLRSIAQEAVALVLSLGGAADGEHGDGLARSEWLEKTFGREIYGLFQNLKTTADPYNIFNPGKIVNPQPMDENLRYGPSYQPHAWEGVFDLSTQGGLTAKIELCNGAGVCRKDDGVMCPSFQVSREEMHSTRGRANLLRALLSGKFPIQKMGQEAVREALDLCLACKGCKAECPSSVDMAQLKYEFTHEYYRTHRRKWRDYLFGWIGTAAPWGSLAAPLVNRLLEMEIVRRCGEKVGGLSDRRRFPKFAVFWKLNRFPRLRGKPDVFLLSDAFSHYFEPGIEKAAWQVFNHAGFNVYVLPGLGAGRTLISKGFLTEAKQQAKKLIATLVDLDPYGCVPVVGIEPSEIYTLRDEFLDFFPQDEYVAKLAKRSWMVEEYLLRLIEQGRWILNPPMPPSSMGKVILHGHCYQKAQPPAEDGLAVGAAASVALLRRIGYEVEEIDSGCCGMAGAFGYEAEHYAFSMQVGELRLFPAIRRTNEKTLVAAAGTSCRAQIHDGSGREALHPVELVWKAMNFEKSGF
jgi:FAD/FMN-containing dehydrogenase/Fe-S oxidoreductase